MEKIKSQLQQIKKPVVERLTRLEEIKILLTRTSGLTLQDVLTVEDYKKMDPYWMSTMTGEFAGRVVRR